VASVRPAGAGPAAPAAQLGRTLARQGGARDYKRMTLATDEFIRRFLIHVLPKGFHRIRHYGLFARPSCADNIARARELLAVPMPQDHNADASHGPHRRFVAPWRWYTPNRTAFTANKRSAQHDA
jgi:hypothetical protein